MLADVPAGARILDEEIFGPVAPITTFRTEDEAIELANATPYGLVCFAYTRDLNRAFRLAERLETGMLGINTGVVSNPARPVRRGETVRARPRGRRRGHRGILETTYVGIADPDQNTSGHETRGRRS